MKNIYFTVGPTQPYPTVLKHIATALKEEVISLSHRSEEFQKIFKNASDNLRAFMEIPDTHHIFFITSALEGMERIVQNTVQKHSFHFINGSFSREFYQIASDLNKQAERFDAPNGEGFDLESVSIPKNTELITLLHNETSTGVSTPMEDIYRLKSRYPDKFIALDFVSSVPYISVDFTYIDAAVFSVQKGFGLPAGLGVLIVNDKVIEKAQWLFDKGLSIGSYHSFLKLAEFAKKYQTRETPNVLDIYLLGKVTQDMLKVGREKIIEETEKKADLLYKYFENHSIYAPYAQNPFRSKTTIVIDVKGDSDKIVKKLTRHGLIVSKGYGKRKDMHIRIANFPTHTIEQVKKLLEVF